MAFAAVASKKAVHKRAHHRNRAKRRLRSVFHEVIQPRLTGSVCENKGSRGSWQVVLLASRDLPQAPWADVVREAEALMSFVGK